MSIFRSILSFTIAGLLEISGCYLVWIWLKNDKPFWYGLIRLVLLLIYSFVPLLQTTNFGIVNAAYGGIFIVLSVLWGWKIDKVIPDKFDIFGTFICIVGIVIIMIPKR